MVACDASFFGLSIILSKAIRIIPLDMSLGSNMSDLEHSLSLPGTLFMWVLGSLSFLFFGLLLDDPPWPWPYLDVNDDDDDADGSNDDFVNEVLIDPLETDMDASFAFAFAFAFLPPLLFVFAEEGLVLVLVLVLILVVLRTTTPQSCNSCSPCSSNRVEKR